MSYMHGYTCGSNSNRFVSASKILFSIDLLFQITIRFIGLKDKQTVLQQLIAVGESNVQQINYTHSLYFSSHLIFIKVKSFFAITSLQFLYQIHVHNKSLPEMEIVRFTFLVL